MKQVSCCLLWIALAALIGGCTLVSTGPTASFVAGSVVIYTGEPVVFDASDSCGSSTIATYEWDLGNGQLTAGERVTSTYDEPGTYTVMLVVSDADGRTDAIEKHFTVYVPSGTVLFA